MNFPTRRKAKPLGVRKEVQIRCQSHLAWIRGHNCLISTLNTRTFPAKWLECAERIEAAHVRMGTDGGLSVKPSDVWTIPLCHFHHAMQHRIGETAFERRFGIDMKKIALELALKSPHRSKWSLK